MKTLPTTPAPKTSSRHGRFGFEIRLAALFASVSLIAGLVAASVAHADVHPVDDAKAAGHEVGSDAKEAGHEVGNKSVEAGHAIKRDSKSAAHGIKDGAKSAAHAIGNGAKAAGHAVASGAKTVGHKIHDAFHSD
jgi:hypothetical protein